MFLKYPFGSNHSGSLKDISVGSPIFYFIFGVPIATILKGDNLVTCCFSDHLWCGSPYPLFPDFLGGPGWPHTHHALAPAFSAGMDMQVALCLARMFFFVLSYQTGSWWEKILICIYACCISQLSILVIKRTS